MQDEYNSSSIREKLHILSKKVQDRTEEEQRKITPYIKHIYNLLSMSLTDSSNIPKGGSPNEIPDSECFNELTDDEFDTILMAVVDEKPASALISVPGAYEIFAEEYNNEVLERYRLKQMEIKKSGKKS